MKTATGIPIQVYEFEKLAHETVTTALRLIEYFRLNIIYFQLISGKGLEFDKIRPYFMGDDPRRIDWKIFAKTDKLNVRAFKEERHYNVVLVFDCSDSMLLGTTDKTKNEYASVVAGALAFAAVEAGDDVSMCMLSEHSTIATDPSGEFFQVLNIISDKKYYGGKKAWFKLVNTLLSTYEQDSIIFIISDFIDTNPEHFLPELSSYFSKVYGVMIRDPVDYTLPEGVGRMYMRNTSGTKSSLTNIDSVRKEYELLARKDVEKIANTFTDYGQLFLQMETTEDFGSAFMKALGETEVEIS